MPLELFEKTTILFQGDSITDCGRTRSDNPETSLGMGYPYLLSTTLAADYPDVEFTFINRGISGNRVKDLKGRWKKDCLDHKPDIVSILIGVNDTWRRYDTAQDPTSAADFEKAYRAILSQTAKTGAQIIILEPFLLPIPKDRETWREDLDPKIHVARKLACEFAAAYVPLDGIFATASVERKHSFWAGDGVHPTPAGHGLITRSWLDAAGL